MIALFSVVTLGIGFLFLLAAAYTLDRVFKLDKEFSALRSDMKEAAAKSEQLGEITAMAVEGTVRYVDVVKSDIKTLRLLIDAVVENTKTNPGSVTKTSN